MAEYSVWLELLNLLCLYSNIADYRPDIQTTAFSGPLRFCVNIDSFFCLSFLDETLLCKQGRNLRYVLSQKVTESTKRDYFTRTSVTLWDEVNDLKGAHKSDMYRETWCDHLIHTALLILCYTLQLLLCLTNHLCHYLAPASSKLHVPPSHTGEGRQALLHHVQMVNSNNCIGMDLLLFFIYRLFQYFHDSSHERQDFLICRISDFLPPWLASTHPCCCWWLQKSLICCLQALFRSLVWGF